LERYTPTITSIRRTNTSSTGFSFWSLVERDAEWISDHLLKLKLLILSVRKNPNGLGRFSLIAGDSMNSFVGSYNVIRTGNPKTAELLTRGSYHWIRGAFVGWNRSPDVARDLADYLYGEILCECPSGSKPFYSFLFEETKKVVV